MPLHVVARQTGSTPGEEEQATFSANFLCL
jgi:hypothetical protein